MLCWWHRRCAAGADIAAHGVVGAPSVVVQIERGVSGDRAKARARRRESGRDGKGVAEGRGGASHRPGSDHTCRAIDSKTVGRRSSSACVWRSRCPCRRLRADTPTRRSRSRAPVCPGIQQASRRSGWRARHPYGGCSCQRKSGRLAAALARSECRAKMLKARCARGSRSGGNNSADRPRPTLRRCSLEIPRFRGGMLYEE